MALEKKRPPTLEEIEEKRKKAKVEIPEGMSKNQWKRLEKEKRWQETKTEYRRLQKQKKKERQQLAIENGEVSENQNYHSVKRKAIPQTQIPSNVKFIMDCEFDSLMNNKEIVSMSNQIARSYSAKRHCDYDLPLTISSFNKNLKKRFETAVPQYKLWKNIDIQENESLSELIPEDQKDKFVYFTADTDEVIETLTPGTTYIIGGIVDKNRHKMLCVNKAKELGLRVGKLPIGKYIEMNGRQVLATSHVYEICCKWFENNQDWEKAFNEVLPPRKIKHEQKTEGTVSTEDTKPKEDDRNNDEKSVTNLRLSTDEVETKEAENKENEKLDESNREEQNADEKDDTEN
jgi:tRNA (guanine9-N1)-methyltransferase